MPPTYIKRQPPIMIILAFKNLIPSLTYDGLSIFNVHGAISKMSWLAWLACEGQLGAPCVSAFWPSVLVLQWILTHYEAQSREHLQMVTL